MGNTVTNIALAPVHVVERVVLSVYVLIQQVIVWLFKPPLPPPNYKPKNPRGRIAVVGAGLTGVSSAAHAIAHGFEVVVFEANSEVGGIWANVNKTSGLQLNSALYRFHPAVIWKRFFPQRDEILSEIRRIWKEYQLESRTRFNTPVISIRRPTDDDFCAHNQGASPHLGHSQWIINDGQDDIFDAIILSVGTCGKPKWIRMEGMPKSSSSNGRNSSSEDGGGNANENENGNQEKSSESSETFTGLLCHSSDLDSLEEGFEGKTVIVIGSGASGVEAVEAAIEKGARKCVMLARDDKWIIPRNTFLDTLIAMQPFGKEMPLSFLWERFLKYYQYYGVEDLIPTHKGLFEGTPIVNSTFLGHIRSHRCTYLRGDTRRLTRDGVLINLRKRGSSPGEGGKEIEVQGDVVVLATGFERPGVEGVFKGEEGVGDSSKGKEGKDGPGGGKLSLSLKEELFPARYERPNLYLQTFCVGDWSVVLTNAAYYDAIGSVGHFHIGIYTRILLTFLMDSRTCPPPDDMKLWVDVVRWIKQHVVAWSSTENAGFGFFTYMELTIWFLIFHLFRLERLRWIFFIMQGWGVKPLED